MNPLYDYFSLVDFAGQWASFFGPVTVKISLLLTVLLLATRLMRGASASSRHLVWALGLAGLLIFPALEAGLPSWQVLPFPAMDGPRPEPAANGRVPVGSTAARNDAETQRAATDVPATVPPGTRDASTPGSSNAAPLGTSETGAVSSPVTGTRSEAGILATARALVAKLGSVPAAAWLFSIWITGVITLVACFVWGMVRLSLLRREAAPLHSRDWQALARKLAHKMGIARPPALLRSPRALTPMTWGLRRPIVLLPTDCDTWTYEQRLEVLLHEFAHIKRRDCITQLSAQLVCILHWFNPLPWIAARQMRTERERACDDHVIMAGVKPSTYASHLLSIACRLRGEEHALRAGLAMARRSRIFDRLDAVLGSRRRRVAPGRLATALAAALIFAALSPLAALEPIAEVKVATADERGVSFVIEDGSDPIRMRWKGEIELTADGRDVEWMSDDAYLVMAQKIDGDWHKIMVEPNSDGELEYTYMIDRKLRDYDARAARWFGDLLEELAPDGEIEPKRPPALPALPDLPALPELPALPALPGGGSGTIRTGEGNRSITWETKSDGVSRKLEVKGEVEFKHDDSGIEWMDDDAYFKIEMKQGRKKHTIEAEAGDDGRPVYEYKIGRKRQPFDGKAEELLAEAIQEIVVELGINADIRVRRVYSDEGVDGMLQLTDRIDSDYSKGIHYMEFFNLEDIREGDAGMVLEQASEGVDSDYELARVLAAYVDKHMTSSRNYAPFLACMSSIDSDYEKARVLQTALKRPRMDFEGLAAVLESAEEIDSDYETARVLAAIDPDLLVEERTSKAYFEVLMAISSDYEKARVLVELAPYARENDNLRDACIDAADSIDSSYEYGRVMKALR
jgi:beta-lactamase regulating signal transducer with metallopeptidase domain